MKIARFLAAVALLSAAAFCVSAQQKPAAPAAAPQTVAIPDSKMALIFSNEFLTEKTGIAKFHSLSATLEREFQPRSAELQALQTRVNTLSKEIDDTQNVADPNAIRQKRDQLAQMNTDLKRKTEDAQAAYQKRRDELFTPLRNDIEKAIEDFAKARGITVVVDGSQMPMLYAANSLDITRAFINDFNAKNPATAAVTQPAGTQPAAAAKP
ncbi:MAG TPA: OmpH family outer membrane protein [Pyrinomonadaceae bacterium]|jgi:Skp family chaperone for outer membrane proteins|nr:OmpH family outer membrane protein [Pyrinomonadaceae bacterium]